MKNLLIIRAVFIMLSIMYLVLGAILIFAKLKQNIFLGIRTKWAMNNEAIWGWKALDFREGKRFFKFI